MRGKWYGKRSTKLFLVLQCSVTCGNGARTRAVECTGGKGKCNARTQPHSTARCYLGSCPEWNVGRWSQVITFAFFFFVFLFFTKNAGLQPATSDLRINGALSWRHIYLRQKTSAKTDRIVL